MGDVPGRDDASLPDFTLLPGVRVGRYTLIRELGAGGMGVVWAARDADLGRDVALKLLRDPDASGTTRLRFLREARAMAKLKHPNVVTVYEVGSHDAHDFIAMELVVGGNLDGWLRVAHRKDELLRTVSG